MCEDLAASVQDEVVTHLVQRVERALIYTSCRRPVILNMVSGELKGSEWRERLFVHLNDWIVTIYLAYTKHLSLEGRHGHAISMVMSIQKVHTHDRPKCDIFPDSAKM